MNLYSTIAGPRAFGALWLILATVLFACGGDGNGRQESVALHPAASTDAVIHPRMYKSPEWIDTYRPEGSAAGYTLVLFKRRVPMLIDMSGDVVHAWPGVRAVGRARLLSTGHLAVIGDSGSLEEYDWQGQKTWSFTLPDSATFLHHDFIQLENGNFLALAHDPSAAADFLLEVDRSGAVVWRWDAAEHLVDELARAGERNNKTHINSVHELPQNRWFDKGHEEFRPGNILISARNLNTVYIVAKTEGQVVWQLDQGLDYQHEATMIPPGIQGAGNILLFNNGYHDLDQYRQSAVLEINPVDKKKVWEYRRQGFYSSTGGTQQSLPNGNLLVTSSQGGRVFELARDGRILWQWSPPFLPMRASRYPEDYAPQLAELQAPSTEPIDRRDPDRFIDENLYTFSLAHETRRVRIAGKSRFILKNPNRCQILQIPRGTKLLLGLGAWNQVPETPYVSYETDEQPVRFLATLRRVEDTQMEPILDRSMDKSSLNLDKSDASVVLIHERIALDPYYGQTVELCLSLTGLSEDQSTGAFVWEEPLIRSPVRRAAMDSDAEMDGEALEKQEKHLKAIGYIN